MKACARLSLVLSLVGVDRVAADGDGDGHSDPNAGSSFGSFGSFGSYSPSAASCEQFAEWKLQGRTADAPWFFLQRRNASGEGTPYPEGATLRMHNATSGNMFHDKVKWSVNALSSGSIPPRASFSSDTQLVDVDFYDGKVYALAARPSLNSSSTENPVLLLFNGLDLNYTGSMYVLNQSSAPWIAIDPCKNMLYSSERYNATHLYKYDLAERSSWQRGVPVQGTRVRLPQVLPEVRGGMTSNSNRGGMKLTLSVLDGTSPMLAVFDATRESSSVGCVAPMDLQNGTIASLGAVTSQYGYDNASRLHVAPSDPLLGAKHVHPVGQMSSEQRERSGVCAVATTIKTLFFGAVPLRTVPIASLQVPSPLPATAPSVVSKWSVHVAAGIDDKQQSAAVFLRINKYVVGADLVDKFYEFAPSASKLASSIATLSLPLGGGSVHE